MARNPSDTTVTVSVLDRLIDREPSASAEPPLGHAAAERLLRASVKRDLEWLLNTRRIAVPPSENMTELNRSVYCYGLPDFTAYGVRSGGDRAMLLSSLAQAIRLYEPRLTDVRVVPAEEDNGSVHRLHFRIEAMLKMDPAPEPISFDTVLELNSGGYQIK
ncbi:MAG TPA: type VI secretion system baseplate subunit TssE [Terriglobales bacterium]|nr:type VI secretion system baseplate subunit TssE [Terriglobales bacterium]